jgi:hypothetical protein
MQFDPRIKQAFENIHNTAAGAARMARQAIDSINELKTQQQQMMQMVGTLGSANASVSRGRPDILRVEEIPGTRVPFDIVVQFGVQANQSGVLTVPYQLSMDGPFIAVSRYAVFMSAYTFQVQTEQEIARLVGRSFGRFRPVSSHLDLMDGQAGTPLPFAPAALNYDCDALDPPVGGIVLPDNRSPFRTMQWDGFISVKNQIYPRQNAMVPSAVWAPGFEQRMDLSVLDYYEKGDLIEFQIEPSHVNNPAAGNVQNLLGSMPQLRSQFDAAEGVLYPEAQCGVGEADVVTRKPDGFLYVGLHGFKILQPGGVAIR